MSYTTISSNPFTVPGTVTGYLDIRKKASANGGVAGPIITVAVPAYSGGTGGGSTGGGTTITQLDTPTNLRQTGATTSSNTLAWNASANAAGYRLRRSGSIVLLPGNSTTYTDSGLSSSSSSSYEVQAIGSGNYSDSSYSAAITATTSAQNTGSSDTTAPSAPGQPAVSNITSSSALLKWTASTDNVGVVGYQIHSAGSGNVVGSVSGTVTQYQVSSLSNGTAYSFYLTATDAAGNVSAASPSASFTTSVPNSQRPVPPQGYIGFVAPDGGSRLRIEETGNGIISPNYQLDGNWIDGGGNAKASGGNFKYILNAPGRVQYIGYFDYAELGAIRSTSAGVLKLTIDNVSYPNINLAANAVAGNDEFQAIYPLANLTWGEHTVVLEYIDGTGTGILDFVDFYTRTY